MRSLLATLLFLGAAHFGVGEVSAQGNMRRPLTSSEETLLEGGRIVVRSTTERRGPLRLFGGTSYIVVDMSVRDAWASITDDSSQYRHMLPQVHSATQVSRDGNAERLIRFTHEVGPVSAEYSLRFQYNAGTKTVMFRLDSSRPHDIRAAWGFFRLRSHGNGKTLVSFGAMVDVGSGLISGALQTRLHEWVLKIPWTFKRHAEGAGRVRLARRRGQ
ncbi:MAG: hypothetical protein ACI9KE_005456 [Polyangiales bacterium]|jgi:hypothetical protein